MIEQVKQQLDALKATFSEDESITAKIELLQEKINFITDQEEQEEQKAKLEQLSQELTGLSNHIDPSKVANEQQRLKSVKIFMKRPKLTDNFDKTIRIRDFDNEINRLNALIESLEQRDPYYYYHKSKDAKKIKDQIQLIQDRIDQLIATVLETVTDTALAEMLKPKYWGQTIKPNFENIFKYLSKNRVVHIGRLDANLHHTVMKGQALSEAVDVVPQVNSSYNFVAQYIDKKVESLDQPVELIDIKGQKYAFTQAEKNFYESNDLDSLVQVESLTSKQVDRLQDVAALTKNHTAMEKIRELRQQRYQQEKLPLIDAQALNDIKVHFKDLLEKFATRNHVSTDDVEVLEKAHPPVTTEMISKSLSTKAKEDNFYMFDPMGSSYSYKTKVEKKLIKLMELKFALDNVQTPKDLEMFKKAFDIVVKLNTERYGWGGKTTTETDAKLLNKEIDKTLASFKSVPQNKKEPSNLTYEKVEQSPSKSSSLNY